MYPDRSRTAVPASAFNPGPILDTLPAEKPISITSSSFCEGSMTRPPRRIRSYVIPVAPALVKENSWPSACGGAIKQLGSARRDGLASRSIGLGAGELHHLGPFLDFCSVEPA